MNKLRLAGWVKAFHITFFVVMTILLLVFLYEVLFWRVTAWSWVTLVLFLVEGLILLVNGWQCPLTQIAESLGMENGQVTHLFLPKWFSDRVFHIYGALFALCCLGLLIRQLI